MEDGTSGHKKSKYCYVVLDFRAWVDTTEQWLTLFFFFFGPFVCSLKVISYIHIIILTSTYTSVFFFFLIESAVYSKTVSFLSVFDQ